MPKDIFTPLASAFATAVGATLGACLLPRVRSGRLARTLDQAAKVIGFVERWSRGYDGLAKISEAKRNDVEKLMLDAMHAVREDFAAERAVLLEFEKTTASVRSALLLYLPHRTIIWLPFLLFHTLLLFMLYILVFRVINRQWELGDAVALLIAGMCAALVRLAVRQGPARE